jgi:hypothetical protein
MNKEIKERIDVALSRVQSIDFFPPRSLKEANSLIPQVERILTDFPIYDWLESSSALEFPRKSAYHNKIYSEFKKAVRASNEVVKKKLQPKIDEYLDEASKNGVEEPFFQLFVKENF